MSENKNINKMPVQIMSMVAFMVKWAFATIPAIIIIYMVVASIPLIIGSLL